MARAKKTHFAPRMEDMIEVTSSNRKKLEAKYEIEIPMDVQYIIPPSELLELMDSAEFWEAPKDKSRKGLDEIS